MRERVNVDTLPIQELMLYKHLLSTGELLQTWPDTLQSEHDSIMHDVVTDKFYSRSADGEIICSPMDRTETWITRVPIGYAMTSTHYDWIYSGNRWFGDTTWPGFIDLPHNTESDGEQALTKAWGTISRSKADILVTVAEGRKTVVGLISVFKRLFKIMKTVKRLQFLRSGGMYTGFQSKKLLKEITPNELLDRWLEVRYGLRPIIYDCKNIVAELQQKQLVKGSRQTFRGVVLFSDEDNDTVDDTWSPTNWVSDIYRYATLTSTARAGVLCQLERVTNLDTFGLLELPEALWDLTMFSFVVDWFIDVGDMIAAWSPSASWSTLTSWITTETVLTQSQVVSGNITWNGQYVAGGPTDGSITRKVISKARLPNPTRTIMPKFSVNLDTFKLIDLVALCRNFKRTIPHVRV